MKFKSLLFLSLCCWTGILNAQKNEFIPETYLGVSGGLSGSMVYFKPTVTQSYLTGKNFGLVYRYNSEKNLGIQLELNYAERGWTELYNNQNVYARRLNYIELPFLTHIYGGNNTRFFINLGPKIAYLISENELYNYYINSTAEQHKPIQNKFEYGLATGLGLLTRFNKQVIQLEVRGSFSLNDIYSNAKKDFFDNSNNIYASANISWLIQSK